MDTVICVEPGQLSLVQRPNPTRQPNEVLIRVRRVGVCGTDYHIFKGNQPFLSYPRVIGHEIAGEVVEADEAGRFRSGEIICVLPYLSCGTCLACRVGKPNCCSQIEVLGVHRDGGLAEYLSVPVDNVLSAESIGIDSAALVEFLAIGAHGIRRARITPGMRVLIVGAGPIGIAAAIFAKLDGGIVTAVDARADRLAFCSNEIGVDHVVPVEALDKERLLGITGRDMYDVVVDATGSPKAMEAGLAWVGHGGTYVLLSVVSATISFDDPEFHKRETTLLASRNATREDFQRVIDAIGQGKVPVDALLTHRTPLADFPNTIEDWLRPEAGVIKAVVEI